MGGPLLALAGLARSKPGIEGGKLGGARLLGARLS